MAAPTTHKKKVVRRSRTTRTTTATKSPTSKKKAVSVVKDAFAKELKLSDRRKRQLLDRRLARAKQLRRTSWYPYGKRTYTFEIPSRKRAGYYEVWSSNGFFLGGGSYT